MKEFQSLFHQVLCCNSNAFLRDSYSLFVSIPFSSGLVLQLVQDELTMLLDRVFQSLFHQVLCCNPHVAPNLNPLHAKDMAAQNGHRLRRILANLSLAQIPPRFANFTPVPP